MTGCSGLSEEVGRGNWREDINPVSRHDMLHSSHKRACLGDETMTMTEILQQAFYKAAELPEDRQEAFARFLLAELESERQWDELFSRPESEAFLERMAAEALEAHRAGKTEMLNLEDL